MTGVNHLRKVVTIVFWNSQGIFFDFLPIERRIINAPYYFKFLKD